MKKRILASLFSLLIMLSFIPMANAEYYFDNAVYLKQTSGSKQCTLVSNVMMLRRRAYLENDPTWADITIESVGAKTWGTGGMSWEYTYDGKKVYSFGVASELGLSLGDVQSKKQYFIENLITHPEGIVIYVYHSSNNLHAVLLTDYDSSTDTFFCADPAPGISSGRIPLSQSLLPSYIKKTYPNTGLSDQDLVIGYVQQTWMIIQGSGPITPSPVQEYLDQCTSEPCNLILTVTVPGHMNVIPCSTQTNPNADEVEPLTVGDQYSAVAKWVNTVNHDWYEVTSKNGQRGFVYSGDVSVSKTPSTLSVSGYEGNPGTPTGTLTPGSNFGLRGIISSNYTITNVEAHIFNSDGSNAVTPYYQTSWNKTSYNIQTDGINNFFSFRSLPINSEANPSYRYVVAASDASANVMRILIDSWFTVGTSTSPVQQYLDQCKSEPCDVTLTVTEPGHMNIMPCSTQTNPQAATVSDDDKNLVVGNTYHSTVQWTNTVGHIWYETTSKTGQRGFVYSGDVSVMMVYTIKEYYDPNISSTLSISGYEGGIPAGNLVQGSNFGLRGVISSNYTITHIEAHIYKSDGTDALPSYSTDWNSTNYDIRTDGINNHFHFRDLPTGTNYNYSVRASDSSGTSLPLIDSYFNIGTSSTSTLTYLNLDGFLDGAPNDGLAQYGTADVYINGQLVANACNDYWEAWTPGTTYEIKNVRANDGYRFNGVYSGSLSGTIGTERINVVLSFSKTAILDLNGCLDGNPYYGNIEGYGTADIYINGELAAEGVSDYCTDFLVGTTYEIKNIRANDGYRFNGVYSGSLSGTIGTERVNVVLSFSKMAILDLNGWLDNNLSWGNIDGYGVVDIYINDELVADSVSDYCSDFPIGTKYEIKNIRALDGHHYDGVHSGALSGVIDSDKVEVFLSFSKITENIIINEDNFPDDVFRAWISNNCDTDGNGILQEAEINAVTTIDVSGTWDNPGMISTIDGIEFFNTLLYLDCSNNQLTNIDVSQNTKLKCLYCFSNDLTSLDVSRNTDLEILECGYNPICNLDTSRNTGLTHLYCYDNQLTSLDVSQNTSLVFLECSSNQLGALNVSNNTSLVSLAIGYNQLQYIDISHNTELKSLTCWSNQLSMLDIGSNPYLQSCVSDGLFTVENGVYYYSLSEEEKLALDSGVNLIVSSPEPDFILPASLTIIGAEAFLGDAFTVVKLSDKTVAISTRAFANCQNLEYIYIPASTTKIAPDVFLGTNDLTILGASGSYAETYAMTFGYTFIAVS